MKNLIFGKMSINNLVGVHPTLVLFSYKVLEKMNIRKEKGETHTDFTIFDGLRSLKTQKEYVKKGVSKTLKSYHTFGLAVDIVVYIRDHGLTWDDKEYKTQWDILLKVCEEVIKENNYPIENGFKKWGWDKPHFQMTGYKKKFNARDFLISI